MLWAAMDCGSKLARLAACAIVWCLAAPPALAAPGRDPVDDGLRCRAAVGSAESAAHLAPGLLAAIGVVESGRRDRTGQVTPWPWTINVAGRGAFFETKEEAIAAVQAVQAAGEESIDVGCMQVNLLQHRGAFASLDEAFDPVANTRYAASFLLQLFARTGTWQDAAAAYHSQTPDIAAPYLARVMAVWSPSGGVPRAFPYTTADDHPDRLPALRERVADATVDRNVLAASGLLLDPRSNKVPPARRLAMLSRRPIDPRW